MITFNTHITCVFLLAINYNKLIPLAVFGASQIKDKVHNSYHSIWLRRKMELPENHLEKLSAWLHRDEDVEVYINGVLAVNVAGFISGNEVFLLTPEDRAALKPGKNSIAMHCHQIAAAKHL